MSMGKVFNALKQGFIFIGSFLLGCLAFALLGKNVYRDRNGASGIGAGDSTGRDSLGKLDSSLGDAKDGISKARTIIDRIRKRE